MAAAPCPVPVEPSGFEDLISTLRDEHLGLWARTPAEMPRLGPRVGLLRQFSNARAARRLIDAITGELGRLPDEERERLAWRETVRERLRHFGQERLGWPDGYRRLLFGDAFFESSVTFVRQARAFDPRMSLEQLGQALRNVWIGNCLQMLLERPVELRPGLFAYSMLYPLTDNWLDAPTVPSAAKRAFNERFGRRLAGRPVSPVGWREAAAFRLVERIEQELPRRELPGVYESLLAIHRGQALSLDQQAGAALSDAEVLSISFEKGGSSLLADLYLVASTPSPAQAYFAFGYGVFLQLLDDLQDVEEDLAVGHETLFTRAARGGSLDVPTARLARFIDRVLAGEGPSPAPELPDRLDLIRRNCRALLVGSVAEHPKLFSRRFRGELAGRWPVSFRASRRLRRRALRRWRRATNALRARGVGSPLEAIGLV